MKQMQKSTFSLLFIIKKSKLRKNGEAPICLRITVNGRIEEVMVKRTVPVASWNQAKECSNGKDHAARELNHYLSTVKARVFQIQRELEIDGVPVTALAVKNRYYGKEEHGKTLCEVYKEHNDKCRALVGIDFTLSTVEKFDTSLPHVREYTLHQYGKDDISLSEMNGQFIRDFEFYLKTVRHCQHNSAIKHLKNLKKVVRIALANEWMKKDPFVGIQFRHEEKSVEFLTQEELERIIHKELPVQRLEQVRDIFVFCCMSGLAFIDVQQLTPGHLIEDNNCALWIRKNRQKTGNICNIPVLSVARRIIDKYADHPECLRRGVVLPVISNQKMNAYLREIADLCGIEKKLTTHVARHTAATVVFLANNVSMENVAKILGHSNTKTTQHYAKVLDSSIMRDMANVEQSLSAMNF
ncbi:MAG: site-specific integrase [Alistipes sp.]|nr:site-specific integrase [Alistipes sp.]